MYDKQEGMFHISAMEHVKRVYDEESILEIIASICIDGCTVEETAAKIFTKMKDKDWNKLTRDQQLTLVKSFAGYIGHCGNVYDAIEMFELELHTAILNYIPQ